MKEFVFNQIPRPLESLLPLRGFWKIRFSCDLIWLLLSAGRRGGDALWLVR